MMFLEDFKRIIQVYFSTNIVSLQTSSTSKGASSTSETPFGDSEHLLLSTSEDLNSDTTADWDKESEACENELRTTEPASDSVTLENFNYYPNSNFNTAPFRTHASISSCPVITTFSYGFVTFTIQTSFAIPSKNT